MILCTKRKLDLKTLKRFSDPETFTISIRRFDSTWYSCSSRRPVLGRGYVLAQYSWIQTVYCVL